MPTTTKINYPVIIGAGQITHREKIIGNNLSVIDLAAMAIENCARDTGRPDILKSVDLLSVVGIFSEHQESPLAKICNKTGINPLCREETTTGGDNPQWLVNRAADRIMAGELKVALLAGAEALYRDIHFRQILDWPSMFARYEKEQSALLGEIRRGQSAHEILHGANRAIHIYPLFENALRAHLHMTISQQRKLLRDYFNNMAAAATGNPYAWFKSGRIQDNITEPSAQNPLFNFPYTKYMNPVIPVNQAAALIMTDTDTARKLGIPENKWVYPLGGAEATDKWYISERINYYSSPVIRFTAAAALKSAGLELPEIDFFDLYSCFPCAAIISALEIGLPLDNLPPLSITGGLAYFGGPGNNYTMHSIVHAVERLRKQPEEVGLVTGVGYFLTKHAVGIYSGVEPKKPWGRESKESIQARIDAAVQSPVLCLNPQGRATIETYTVLHDTPDGEPFPVIIARLDSGERCFATTKKGSNLAARMEEEEFIGYKGTVSPGHSQPNIFSC